MFADGESEDGWWGHFGVLLHEHDKTKWYPITLGTANRISSQLANCGAENDWIIIQTLNNRILSICPARVQRLWLLDDAQDQPGEDWELPVDGYEGRPSEFYQGLEDYMWDGDISKYSDEFKKFLDHFTDDLDFGEDELSEFLLYTKIYDVKGKEISYWVDENKIHDLIIDIEQDCCSEIFDLSCDNFDSYFPSNNLSMLDMPLRQVMNAADRN